ncbi:AHH domain-containing protein [Sorangium sp. So ce363]|uniref:AHH domain-containing protein n=1 Tax=Sorangium sp. So ce363 TaxID=3133304 RepID=UPI003F630A45
MTQLGESVNLGEIDQDEFKCPFEHTKPGQVDNALGSDSASLGSRLAEGYSTQLWADEGPGIVPKTKQKLVAARPDDCPEPPVVVDGQEYPYSSSAHHLIPGEASLPKSTLIKFISKDATGSKIWGDIGYDVNGGENGIWLPTHHALSAEMKEGLVLPGEQEALKYSELTRRVKRRNEENQFVATFQERFTASIMERASRQFHDAHPDYSGFVIKVLDKLKVNIVEQSSACKKCDEVRNQKGKFPPPHGLVSRLNSVSARLYQFLVGPPQTWRPPLYTSRFAAGLAELERAWLRRRK